MKIFKKFLFCKSFADYAVSCLFFLNIISVDKNLMCSNTESTKRGILGSRIPRKVLQGEEGFTQKSRILSQVPKLSEKSSSIAIMYASDDSILYKVLLTRIFIYFLLPYHSIFWDISRIHLIHFVAQITLK